LLFFLYVNNRIHCIKKSTLSKCKKLQHLGLCNNCLTNEPQLQQLSSSLEFLTQIPWLLSLDLSFNSLSNLELLMETLKTDNLPNLMILFLHGNVFCLLPHYRDAVIYSLTQLMHLDGKAITETERNSAVATMLAKAASSSGNGNNNSIEIHVAIQKLTGVTIEGTPKEQLSETDKKKSAALKKNVSVLPPSDEPVYEKLVKYSVKFYWYNCNEYQSEWKDEKETIEFDLAHLFTEQVSIALGQFIQSMYIDNNNVAHCIKS